MVGLKKNVSGYFPQKSGRKVHVAAQKSEDIKGVHTWLNHKRVRSNQRRPQNDDTYKAVETRQCGENDGSGQEEKRNGNEKRHL